MDYEYKWLPGPLVPPDLAKQLAALYSEHYGRWSAAAPTNPGGPVRLSAARVGKLLEPKEARLAYAMSGNAIVGYAIAIQAKIPKYGFISWVTQLVVHADHRKKDVGKSLLFAIWTFTDHFAWGLLTANPYAIRALEKATRRRCEPRRIFKNRRKLTHVALRYVDYVDASTEVDVTQNTSRIDTRFQIDHSALPAMLQDVSSGGVPWEMGPLPEGWEWLAFTFHDQKEIDLAPEEIEIMLKTSDDVARRAYSRMLLNRDHRWAQFAKPESRFVASITGLKAGASVLDFGCGTGRHALEFAAMDFNVCGVDYLDALVARARDNAQRMKLADVQFDVADCRNVELGRQFDLVICLYDVIGTFADDKENARIAENIARHVKPGGHALVSVMNLELTERRAKHLFSMTKEPNKLLSLRPSRTMEQTGDIFDPDYYMLDTDTHVVYRKEQFAAGSSLPAELIVRDRRYRKDEIERICSRAGLDVQWSRFVRAGKWDDPIEQDADSAKEILVYCKKR